MPLSFPVIGINALGASGIAEGMVGLALEKSLSHARDRKVNGQPLGNYQAVQFMLAEISCELEATRALLYKTASEIQLTPGIFPLAACNLKLFATESFKSARQSFTNSRRAGLYQGVSPGKALPRCPGTYTSLGSH